jgi:GNAT superfamily N-acetyltransferase
MASVLVRPVTPGDRERLRRGFEALLALEPGSLEVVGVGRYIRSRQDVTSAELAVAVVDRWQRRGVGSELARRLAALAAARGIRRFTGTMTGDNLQAQHLFSPACTTYEDDHATVAVEIHDIGVALRPKST